MKSAALVSLANDCLRRQVMTEVRKNESETASSVTDAAGAIGRESAETTETLARTGAESARRAADEFARMFGVGGQNEQVTRQAQKNVEVLSETGSVLMRGLQDVTTEWFDFMQARLQKNIEGMTKLAQCRSVPDLAAVQTDLLRENMQEMIDGTKHLAERSVRIANEAGQKIGAASQARAGARQLRAA